MLYYTYRLFGMRMNDTRSEILIHARALIGKRGYADVSMADIATDVGIAKSSIYHFFDDKESLFAEVITKYIKDAADIYAYGDDEVPSRVLLAQKLTQGIQYGIDHGGLVASFEHIPWTGERGEIIGRAFENLHDVIIDTLSQSEVPHPSFAVHMILDMGYAYLKKNMCGHHTWTVDEFINHLITHCYA